MDNTKTKQSATVDVLSAEVRVLMVGSRQVTLSVYHQLDQINPFAIEPFGRVHAYKRMPYNTIDVVGRDERHGDLARARLEWGPKADDVLLYDLPKEHRKSIASEPQRASEDIYGIVHERDGVRVVWVWNSWETVEDNTIKGWKFVSPEAKRDAEGLADIAIEEYLTYKALWERFEALPLIVLAGLR